VSQVGLRVAATAVPLVESAVAAKPEDSPPEADPASAAAECTAAGVECMVVAVATAAVADANHLLS
ncbi:MAG: hypothetical protein WBM24_12380, partial [Candidatus Sulfotelmatobacter sp.]